MKMSRKILSLVLALVMVMGLAVTAMADETTPHTITITNALEGHTYEAYQVFTGTVTGGDNNTPKILTNIEWGDGVNSAALLTALQNYTNGTPGYESPYKDCNTADDVANVLKDRNSDGPRVDAFAEVVSNHLATVAGTANAPADGKYVINVKGDGYYFVKDANPVTGNDTVTKYMLRVARDVTVAPKSDKPRMDKKVKDRDDSAGRTTGWQDGADYDIGDNVPFRLKGTVTSHYDVYDTYAFTFHDTMATGLTFQPTTVKAYVGNRNSVTNTVEYTEIAAANYVVNSAPGDGHTFDVVFSNLKEIPDVKGGSEITVEYEAKLNENAVIGAQGNPNTAYLEFSNNPYGEETGETPKETAIVFTYQLTVNKKMGDGTTELPGAAFKLEKKLPNDADGAEKWKEVDRTPAAGEATTFEFKGLDDGTYKLTEITTPSGYNTITPIEFTIHADHGTSGNPATLNEIYITVPAGSEVTPDEFTVGQDADKLTGVVSTNVVNQAGTQLPTTGGMGTTLFYVIGAILVFGAVVLLVTKKRMSGRA